MGFDCSGFVTSLLRQIGFPLPPHVRHCRDYFSRLGEYVEFGNHQTGDLVFFSWDSIRVSHIGIMLDEKKYIQASGTDGKTVNIQRIKLRPIKYLQEGAIYNVNPIGFKRIP